MKIKLSRKPMLEPSFWRTCRALKNPHRLDLLKDVFAFEDEFGVTAFGQRAGVSESTASTYLRQMGGWRGSAPNDTVKRYSRGGFVTVDPSVRRLRRPVASRLIPGCGAYCAPAENMP